MKSFSTKTILFALSWVFCATVLTAQSVRQVIIANGEVFSPTNYAKIAAWNPQTNNYFVFDSIAASSVQDVVIEGNVAYVAADSTVRAYDIDNYTVLASGDVKGVRKLAIYNNSLLATRGFPVTSDYVKVLDKSTLAETASITGLPTYAEGIVVVDDSAYVSVPGSFMDTTGSLAVIDLSNNSLATVMQLGPLGRGIHRVFFHEASNRVYSLNPLGYGSTTGAITSYEIGSRNPINTEFPFTVGSIGGIYNDRLYAIFDASFTGMELPGLSLSTQSIAPGGTWAAGIPEPLNGRFYLTETDYFSYGRLSVYDTSGTLLDTITTGISPEALAVEYGLSLPLESPFNNEIYITAYPNPVTDVLNVDASRLKQAPLRIDLIDLGGRVVVSGGIETALEVSALPAGTYFVRVRTKIGDYLKPIIKQ